LVRKRLESVQWEVLKVNAKTKLDHKETACDVDELMIAATKLPHFPKKL
jgi:hypothetical protein